MSKDGKLDLFPDLSDSLKSYASELIKLFYRYWRVFLFDSCTLQHNDFITCVIGVENLQQEGAVTKRKKLSKM